MLRRTARRLRSLCLALLLASILAGCGDEAGGPLLSQVTPDAGRLDLANGVNLEDGLSIYYRVGRPARISVGLDGPAGFSHRLRQDEERAPGDYQLRLDGSYERPEEGPAPGPAQGLTQVRLLPSGRYNYTIRAVAGDQQAEQTGGFEVVNSPASPAPALENLAATPATISPNFDAREDTAALSWRLTAPATVTVAVSGDNGFAKVLKTIKNSPAQEDRTDFNGLDLRGEPLPDGLYTWTVQAADRWGNLTRRSGRVEVRGGGVPQATIEQATITPNEIIRGNTITVTVRVRNTGKVPIRTQGPDSGYTYSTNDVFSSIESGKYVDRAGFWRIGVDYESNNGGGASRYPFRWGLGRDLLPGETVEVSGRIKVERQEDKLRFYVGLIQEQIKLPQDRIQPTLVKINY